jgi:hypothetical protein
MDWSTRRKIFYGGIMAVFLLFVFILIFNTYFNKKPTCFDGKQNGEETGVDCGGSCQKICTFQVDQVSVLWRRAFKVASGRYNAIAYLENKNINALVQRVNYRFRFADKDNVFIASREGTAYIPPTGKFAIFEPAVGVGGSDIVYTTFEFIQVPIWQQAPEDKLKEIRINTSEYLLEDQNTTPRLTAKIKNNSLFKIPNISVVAILYDDLGNAIDSSRTFVDMLDREEEEVLIFTWQERFKENVSNIEIIPIYNILQVSI